MGRLASLEKVVSQDYSLRNYHSLRILMSDWNIIDRYLSTFAWTPEQKGVVKSQFTLKYAARFHYLVSHRIYQCRRQLES